MKQKAAIAVSLVHDPDIVIFDEPTNGLDIVTARSVTDYLKKLRDDGKLVIVSTHIMSEAEKLCDRIGIIIDGYKVAEAASGTDQCGRLGGRVLRVLQVKKGGRVDERN